MSIEKLTVQAIIRILEETSKSDRRWRDSVSQCFKDFTAIKVIENVSLRGAELNYSIFRDIAFSRVRFEDARLFFCDFSECSFDSCDFSDVHGAFANFQSARFKNCLIDAPLQFANFESVLFSRCSFGNSNLLMANLKNSKFEASEGLDVRFLDNSNTEEADLSGLRIDRSNYPSL